MPATNDREKQQRSETPEIRAWPPSRLGGHPKNRCPACCHAPGVPALRMLSLRELVARTRVMEIASLTASQPANVRLGYVVCVEGTPIVRVAHPSVVTCHMPEPGDPDFEADIPISGVVCGLLEINSQVKTILRGIAGEAGRQLRREDLAERGCAIWPGRKD